MNNQEEIVELVREEIVRRQQHRHRLRILRDTSNPFEMPDVLFRQMYRLNKQAAQDLFHEIEGFMLQAQRNTRTAPVIRFFTTLLFLAHGSYQKPVGMDRINSSSQPNVSRSVHEVVDIIVINVAHGYIKFPQTADEIFHTKNGFFRKHEIPGIIGCLDCTHIKIVPPNFQNLGYPPNVFMNRKGFYSINCQIVCDVDTKILSVNAQYPGSVHDAAIWRMSNVRINLHEKFFNGDHSTFLLGDSGYPLLPYLLTPIVGAQNGTPEARYTRKHKAIRSCIERTNGILKGIWRCLHSDRVLHYRPEMAAKIIYACCVLHNIIRMRNIPVDFNLIVEEGPDVDDIDDLQPGNVDYDAPLLNWGNIVRNRIVMAYFPVV